ncbi:hypothetical protein NC651_003408 [Populus alba x Populus x berolinensis]|nr:hypothetical protein NC651_003408 [Populus alba x Populus x berolinensis]
MIATSMEQFWDLSFRIRIQKSSNYLTLQESPGIVHTGRLPRYKEVILLNDLIDCAHPREEIEAKGVKIDYWSYNESQEDKASARPVDPELLSQDLLKKYITSAKLNIFPRFHDSDMEYLC